MHDFELRNCADRDAGIGQKIHGRLARLVLLAGIFFPVQNHFHIDVTLFCSDERAGDFW